MIESPISRFDGTANNYYLLPGFSLYATTMYGIVVERSLQAGSDPIH